MGAIPDSTGAAQRHAGLHLIFNPASKLDLAQRLDRQADAELFLGRVVVAERLAHLAAGLRREVTR